VCTDIKHSLSAVKKRRREFANGKITPEDDPQSGRLLRSDLVNLYRR
jgi:hypothetical protein